MAEARQAELKANQESAKQERLALDAELKGEAQVNQAERVEREANAKQQREDARAAAVEKAKAAAAERQEMAAKSAEERAVAHAEATAALVKGIVPAHSVSPAPLYVEVGTISGLELYRRVETAPKEEVTPKEAESGHERSSSSPPPHRKEGQRLSLISGKRLSLAAERGDLAAVQAELDSGANVNDPLSNHWTALHRACQRGHLDIVRLISSNGADVHVKTAKSRQTPLHLACQGGHLEIVRELVRKGANVRVSDVNGLTPVATTIATLSGNPRDRQLIVKELLSAGADEDDQHRTFGGTESPMHRPVNELGNIG